MNLSYFGKERYRWEDDEKGNAILKNDDFVKEELNHEGDGLLEGKTAFGAIDEKGYLFVSSEFIRLSYLQNFFRKNGGFGV